MNIAFYAPLKSPHDPVPSGDRLIGRMLLAALSAGGHDVRVVSRLRSFDRGGDADRQRRLAALGDQMAVRIVRRMNTSGWRPDLWLTYHLYHKAPDWIGPPVSGALRIPYCVAEASSAPRYANGKWAQGHASVASALGQAALVLNLNPKDLAGIAPLVTPQCRQVTIAPFTDGTPYCAARALRAVIRSRLAVNLDLDPAKPWLITVGMMRTGDKLASFERLAAALGKVLDQPWQLLVIGDGEARRDVETAFVSLNNRVRWLGRIEGSAVAEALAAADLLVWPAINEAIGMVFIEAAMAGLPVVGADRPGIAAVVANGETGLLVPEGDADAFASAVRRLVVDRDLRASMGRRAVARAAAFNDIATAGRKVCDAVEAIIR